jgi:putative PIN family toxin of toxin-antitoxin system
VRVVFDTNIFVSALALPGGPADHAIRKIVDGRDHLLVSRPIIVELLDVLARKFRRDAEDLARVAVFVADLAETVESHRKLRVLSDEADNRILECAVAGIAEAIVTGDRAMLKLRTYRGIRLMTLREYLDE